MATGPIQEAHNISKLLGPMLVKFLQCKRNNKQKEKVIITISLNQREISPGDDDQGPSAGCSSQADVKTDNCDGPSQAQPQTCRICLQEGDIPIYGDDVYEDVSQSIDLFCGIELKEYDEYPKHICNSCFMLLESALTFRKTAQQSDKILRGEAGKNMNKLSPVEDDTKLDHDYDNEDDDEAFQYLFKINKKKIKKRFACKTCRIDFDTRKEYKNHILSEEHKGHTQICPICKNTYKSSYFSQHLEIHKKVYKHLCDLCGKKITTRSKLVQHRLSHFVDNLHFKCSSCPYKTRTAYLLKLHMRSHTGEKPYQCPECPNKSFSFKSNLNKHMLIHKGDHDFNFKCTQCTKGFNRKKDLDLHYKIDHIGIKDCECNICGKAFGYRRQMIKHQLKVHKREKLRTGMTPLYILAESKKLQEQDAVKNTLLR